jgi:hypothetical protein
MEVSGWLDPRENAHCHKFQLDLEKSSNDLGKKTPLLSFTFFSITGRKQEKHYFVQGEAFLMYI